MIKLLFIPFLCFFSSRAISAGMKKPLLSISAGPKATVYEHSALVGLLGALHALYVVGFHAIHSLWCTLNTFVGKKNKASGDT